MASVGTSSLGAGAGSSEVVGSSAGSSAGSSVGAPPDGSSAGALELGVSVDSAGAVGSVAALGSTGSWSSAAAWNVSELTTRTPVTTVATSG